MVPCMPEQIDWQQIRQLALRHRKALWLANLTAVLATLCSVPIPLLLPLLVDEVLLGEGDAALRLMDHLLPDAWQQAAGYIGLMLLLTLLMRSMALLLNVLQARLFARLSKDVVYRLRLRLIERQTRVPMVEITIPTPADVSAHRVGLLLGKVPARIDAGEAL